MIKTKAYGCYELSTDGGKTFYEPSKNLILNNYYSKSFITNSMKLAIGDGSTPPELTDTSLGNEFAESSVEIGFDSLAENSVFVDRFEVKFGRLFNFGNGHTGTIRELGVKNPDLCSRALMLAPDGQPTEVKLYNTDQVLVRYSIIYVIPRVPVVFPVLVNGLPVNATITAVNGSVGAWATPFMGEIVKYDFIGSATAGNWTIAANGDLVGGNITNGSLLTTAVNGILGLTIVGTANIDTDEWIGTFQQLLITSSGNDYITSPILIDFDVPITKTNTEVIAISINVNQGP